MAMSTVTPGFETAHLLSTIIPLPLDEIGSNQFMEAYCINLERLSIQAHCSAAQFSNAELILNGASALDGGEEFVVEAFLECPEKIVGMVRTLLSLEYWRDRVLFRNVEEDLDCYEQLHQVDGGQIESLANKLADNGNGLRVAFILHAETTIVSMLNLIFYRGIPATLLENDEVLLALVDYCARQLVSAVSFANSNPSRVCVQWLQLCHFGCDGLKLKPNFTGVSGHARTIQPSHVQTKESPPNLQTSHASSQSISSK